MTPISGVYSLEELKLPPLRTRADVLKALDIVLATRLTIGDRKEALYALQVALSALPREEKTK